MEISLLSSMFSLKYFSHRDRRLNRQRHPSIRYKFDEYVTLTGEGEPECFKEAIENDDNQKRLDAMHDEIKSLHDNHTYDLVKFLESKMTLENMRATLSIQGIKSY